MSELGTSVHIGVNDCRTEVDGLLHMQLPMRVSDDDIGVLEVDQVFLLQGS
jgi:hypothetical protein